MRVLNIVAALCAAGGMLAACAAGPNAEPAEAGAAPAAAPPQAAIEAREPMRFILKLKDPHTAVDTPAMLGHLAKVSRSEIVYVRAMSGDAHVLILRTEAGVRADAALQRIKADPLVEYAEPDAVKRALPAR